MVNSKRLYGSNQFKSTQLFKHRSIRDSCEISNSNEDQELQFNLSINDSNEKSGNLEMKIQENRRKRNRI